MKPITYAVQVSPPKEGESGVYRHPSVAKGNLLSELIYLDGVRVSTLHDNFMHGANINKGKNNCMGERIINKDGTAGAFKWITYKEAVDRLTNVASGLLHLPLCPLNKNDKMQKLGFFARNRLDWVICQQACHKAGIVVVPMYDTLGPDAAEYVVAQSELTTIVCGGKELDVVIAIRRKCPVLNFAIVLDPITPQQKKQSEELGLTILSLAHVEKIGSENLPKNGFPKIDPTSVATFCYTSGTTGDPKGAMETHRSILTDSAGASASGLLLLSSDVHLSYLPLAHMFEIIVQVAVFGNGGSIGFFQGDTLKLIDDLVALRPTVFPSVPRLYNRIYDKLIAGIEAKGGLAKWMFTTGYASKKYYLDTQNSQHHVLWDTLIFDKIKATVGLDRCRMMITGSAPLATHVMDFLRIVFGATVLEGYGQTECAAAATLTSPLDFTLGHVGGPVACNEIKLVDVPDMNYTAKDKPFPRGEVCFRGPNVFAGYYKMEDKTKEAIDSDGWLHSGDIGALLPNGAIKIIDRKKNIFKLAQGEYVAAEKIENVFLKSSIVAQSFVYGDSLQSSLVAIIVPDPETFPKWAKERNLPFEKGKLNNAATHKAVIQELDSIGKANGLQGFELVKAIYLEITPWTPDEKEAVLTPTFKLQRRKAQDRYQKEIDHMYSASVVAGLSGLKQSKL